MTASRRLLADFASGAEYLVEHPRPDNQCNGRWRHSPPPVRPLERLAERRNCISEEVEAVFGDEVGHAKHHHILFMWGSSCRSVWSVFQIWNVATSRVPAIAEDFPATEDWAHSPFVGLAFATSLWFLAFFLDAANARRMSSAVRTVSCARCRLRVPWQRRRVAAGGTGLSNGFRTFIDSAREGCAMNDISRSCPGWFQSWATLDDRQSRRFLAASSVRSERRATISMVRGPREMGDSSPAAGPRWPSLIRTEGAQSVFLVWVHRTTRKAPSGTSRVIECCL